MTYEPDVRCRIRTHPVVATMKAHVVTTTCSCGWKCSADDALGKLHISLAASGGLASETQRPVCAVFPVDRTVLRVL